MITVLQRVHNNSFIGINVKMLLVLRNTVLATGSCEE